MNLKLKTVGYFFGLTLLAPPLLAASLAAQESTEMNGSKSDQEPAVKKVSDQPSITPVLMKPGKLIFSDNTQSHAVLVAKSSKNIEKFWEKNDAVWNNGGSEEHL